MNRPKKTALIAGASGLVGSFCLRLLLQSDRYFKVIAIGRSALPMQHPKLEQVLVDFDNLEAHKYSLIADDIFCCLGTTIKQAGSKPDFYKVDYTYVVKLATLTAKSFASQFLVVSSLGASAGSPIFYSKVKGQMENAIKPLSFLAVLIFQPSLLLGPRREKRLGEKIAGIAMRALNFALVGPLRKYRPVTAEEVAQAMLYEAMQDGAGVRIHDSERIKQEAKLLVV